MNHTVVENYYIKHKKNKRINIYILKKLLEILFFMIIINYIN